MKALLIPVEGPIEEIDLNPDDNGSSLAQLQALVGGYIQALPMPDFIGDNVTAYINEEGKYSGDTRPNMRATDFMVPGVGLMMGDYIAGPFVLCGFDAERGENTDIPARAVRRARVIEREAA